MGKDKFKDVINKLWPRTKKELEKAIETAKSLIDKGEEHIKILSEKSIDSTKKISLGLRKEKVYYNLGKQLAVVPKGRWGKDEKIGGLINTIKAIDREVKKLDKKLK
ncbi:MAG: hypothetical protein ABH858_01155 [Candidatus Omnitrophota bacterium]